jgi:hypothetical protein
MFQRLRTLGAAGMQQRQADVDAATALLARLKVRMKPDALSTVLDQCRETQPATAASANKRSRAATASKASDEPVLLKACKQPQAPKWKAQHQSWMRKKGLKPKDLAGAADFQQRMGSMVLDRQREALWLKLSLLRKRKDFDWRSGLVVATVGASVSWMGVTRNAFPCVTPQMAYILLDNGIPKAVDGILLLALQGIQKKEVQRFKLNAEKDALLRNLSGNAFTANILAACILAALPYM